MFWESVVSEDLSKTLSKLKALEEEYFSKFNQYYPGFYDQKPGEVFGPNEIYEMAIEAEVLLSELGSTAVKRLQYIGFGLLFPFSNPVDWFNWKTAITERRISHTIYFSISMRVVTEFKRMEIHLQNNTWDKYCELSESEFSVSKNRYTELFFEKNVVAEEEPSPVEPDQISVNSGHNIHIENLAYNEKAEEEAVNNLDQLQKKTSIWSNIASVASTIVKIIGMKT